MFPEHRKSSPITPIYDFRKSLHLFKARGLPMPASSFKGSTENKVLEERRICSCLQHLKFIAIIILFFHKIETGCLHALGIIAQMSHIITHERYVH